MSLSPPKQVNQSRLRTKMRATSRKTSAFEFLETLPEPVMDASGQPLTLEAGDVHVPR